MSNQNVVTIDSYTCKIHGINADYYKSLLESATSMHNINYQINHVDIENGSDYYPTAAIKDIDSQDYYINIKDLIDIAKDIFIKLKSN